MFSLFREASIGIDVADHSIEAVELERHGTSYRVSKLGRVEIQKGIVERGDIKNAVELARMVKKVFEIAHIKPTGARPLIFGLSESKSFVHQMSLPRSSPREWDALVASEIKRIVPIEPSDLLYEYAITEEEKDAAHAVIAAASKTIASKWRDFFASCSTPLALIDIETFAILRGLFAKLPPRGVAVAVLDIGAVTSTLSVFDSGGLQYSHSLPIGGEYLTEKIATALAITPEEAETRKRASGFSRKNTRTLPVLIRALEPVVSECKSVTAALYGEAGTPVSELICVGGSARMPGLVPYLEANLDVPVRVGSPSFAGTFPKAVDAETDSLLYIEAVGLALRHFQHDSPAFPAHIQGHSFAKMFPWRR
jgi:type IV pilus assembly protein PilM